MKKNHYITRAEVNVSEIEKPGPRDGELVLRLEVTTESGRQTSMLFALDHAANLGDVLKLRASQARKLKEAYLAPL